MRPGITTEMSNHGQQDPRHRHRAADRNLQRRGRGARDARWLITAGTPGLDAGGKVPPDFGAQAELAWTHIVTMLKRADMSVHDLVKVTQYLVRSSDIAAYAEVRARHLGSARPASLLLIVPALVQPEFLLEIEAYAAKA